MIGGSGAADLRAYAVTNPSGAAVMLFNLNQPGFLHVTISVTSVTSSSDVTRSPYDCAAYDQSRHKI